MNIHLRSARQLLFFVCPRYPGFKLGHAHHIVAALHGYRNKQAFAPAEHKADFLPPDAMKRALARSFEKYQMDFDGDEVQYIVDNLRRLRAPAAYIDEIISSLAEQDAWKDEYPQILQYISNAYGSDLNAEDVRELLTHREDLVDEIRSSGIGTKRHPYIFGRMLDALRAKLKYPDLATPKTLMIKITRVKGYGECEGEVLYSPSWAVEDNAAYRELRFHIVRSDSGQQEESYLSEARGEIHYSRQIFHQNERTLPLREVGEIVTFDMTNAGAFSPAFVNTKRLGRQAGTRGA